MAISRPGERSKIRPKVWPSGEALGHQASHRIRPAQHEILINVDTDPITEPVPPTQADNTSPMALNEEILMPKMENKSTPDSIQNNR